MPLPPAATTPTTPTTSRCRRAECARPSIGRGLCPEHYGRWQLGSDPLDLPGDTAPAPERRVWVPIQRPFS
ncbi:MAG: hypothetical protein GEU86_11760 [Actinophytocola sp.]|nr:hypothetical protein [Actinophytocola sp.]